MDPAVWKQLLFLALPVIGRGIKAVPFINNQVIPFILAAFATAKNYWIMAGLPVELVPETIAWMPGDSEYALAGMFAWFGGGVAKFAFAAAWGGIESALLGRVQRSFKHRDRYKALQADGTISAKDHERVKAVDRWWV